MQRSSTRCIATSATSLASTSSTPTATKLVARTRPLPLRKQILYKQHQDLLTTNKVVLFLRPTEFSAHEWRELRAELGAVATPSNPSTTHDDNDTNAQKLKLTVLRPGLLPALLRDPAMESKFDPSLLSQHLRGPLAVLTTSELHPPTLKKVLTILNKYSSAPSRNAPPVDPKATAKSKDANKPQRLPLLSSLFHMQSASPSRTTTVSKMPSLDVLRSQIVGLLSMPGARITGILGQRATEVSRTLQGFKQGLQDAQSQGATSAGDQPRAGS
ncbi:hypothetical protein OIO90_003810 [Microbotryomycetes sp. JL221]|nr:hypothetical protein OIO90_003810 [Microbotryomycetes sp. JL221]